MMDISEAKEKQKVILSVSGPNLEPCVIPLGLRGLPGRKQPILVALLCSATRLASPHCAALRSVALSDFTRPAP